VKVVSGQHDVTKMAGAVWYPGRLQAASLPGSVPLVPDVNIFSQQPLGTSAQQTHNENVHRILIVGEHSIHTFRSRNSIHKVVYKHNKYVAFLVYLIPIFT
jgi:hypothetical protein